LLEAEDPVAAQRAVEGLVSAGVPLLALVVRETTRRI
jgi:hypothetical protein